MLLSGVAMAALILAVLFVGFAYPSMMILFVLCTPVFKLGLIYYLPVFQMVDLTALVCTMVLILGVWNYFRYAEVGPPLMVPWRLMICLVLIGLLLIVGAYYSTAPIYGWRKALRFMGIGVPFLLVPSFYIRFKQDGHALIRMAIMAGILTALFLIFAQDTRVAEESVGGYGRSRVLGGSPGGSAQAVGVCTLLALTPLIIKGGASRFARWVGLIALPLGLVAILLSGSRSSLLYLFASAALLPMLGGRGARTKGIMVAALLMPLALIIGFRSLAKGDFAIATRWTAFLETGGQSASASRFDHWMFVLEHWWERPVIGHGSGSFAMDYGGMDDPNIFPHNIILEALYETGFVGAAILILFFGYTARTALQGLRAVSDGNPRDRVLILSSLMWVLFLSMRGMTSVDLDGMRFLYLACGILHVNVGQVLYGNQQAAWAPSAARAHQQARAGPQAAQQRPAEYQGHPSRSS